MAVLSPLDKLEPSPYPYCTPAQLLPLKIMSNLAGVEAKADKLTG
jgi:hypothetical protein